MHKHRSTEFCGGLEHGKKVRVIKVLVARATTKHRSRQSKIPHASLKFERSVCRRGRRQRGEPLEPCGIARDGSSNQIIGALRQGHAFFRLEVVQGWSGHRQNLHLYPAFVHKSYPTLFQVAEPFLDLAPVEPGSALLANRGRCPRSTNISG